MSRIVKAATGTDPYDVARTVAAVAKAAASRLDTRLWAQKAVAPYAPRHPDPNDRGRWYAHALGRWAQSVAPLREPAELGELVQAPWRTVAYRSGDCDDVACAVAAFAALVGLFSAVAVYPTGPSSAHIVAVIGDDWTPRLPSTTAVITESAELEAHRPLWSIDQRGRTVFRATPAMKVFLVKD